MIAAGVAGPIEMMDNLAIQARKRGACELSELRRAAVVELDVVAEVAALIRMWMKFAETIKLGRFASRNRMRSARWCGREGKRRSQRWADFADYIVQDGVIPRTELPNVMREIGQLSRELDCGGECVPRRRWEFASVGFV